MSEISSENDMYSIRLGKQAATIVSYVNNHVQLTLTQAIHGLPVTLVLDCIGKLRCKRRYKFNQGSEWRIEQIMGKKIKILRIM